MNTKFITSILLIPFFIFAFYNVAFSKKDGAPAEKTGGPGENSCGSGTTGCHFKPANQCGTLVGQLLPLNTDLQLRANGTIIDNNFKYTPGTTYNMEFEILKPTANGGFSLTTLNANNEFVGVLATSDVNASVISNTANDKDYVGHIVSLGLHQWSFTWEAPVAGTGNVSIYASANKANGAVGGPFVNSCGDTIIPYKFEITELIQDTTTAISSFNLENKISISNNPILNNTIIINTIVKQPKKFYVTVYDLSGKKIATQEKYFHTGLKNIEIPLIQKGIFVLSISTDLNEFANYKILNK